MSWFLDFLDALSLIEGLTGRQLSTGPLTEREIILLRREISALCGIIQNSS